MEDKLIVVVCGYPELYDTTSYFYKNRNKKDLAWKKVSEEVGQSGKLLKTLFTQFELYMKSSFPKRDKRQIKKKMSSSCHFAVY